MCVFIHMFYIWQEYATNCHMLLDSDDIYKMFGNRFRDELSLYSYILDIYFIMGLIFSLG